MSPEPARPRGQDHLRAVLSGGLADGQFCLVTSSPILVTLVDGHAVALPGGDGPREGLRERFDWQVYEVDLDAEPDVSGAVPFRAWEGES